MWNSPDAVEMEFVKENFVINAVKCFGKVYEGCYCRFVLVKFSDDIEGEFGDCMNC